MAGPSRDNYRHPFVQAIVAGLRKRCGVRRGSRVLLAVSGGADSVALLRAMAIIAPRRPWQLSLSVGHVNHHLRDDAKADADFVRHLAEQFDLPFHLRDVYPSQIAQPADGEGNLESRARSMRYAALADIAVSVDAGFVAVAHHGDDQLETVLMRLMRGSSVRGMSAMRWRRRLRNSEPRPLLVRPMLGVDHAGASEFLRSIGQPWREDHTNADISRWRARLRSDVLPVLKQLQPNAAEGAQRFAEHCQELWHWLEQQASAAAHEPGLIEVIHGPHGQQFALDRASARDLSPPVLNELMRQMLIGAGVGADALPRRKIDRVTTAVRDSHGGLRRFEFAGGVVLTVDRQQVRTSQQTVRDSL